MRWKLDDLPQELRKQAERKLAASDRVANQPAKLKQDPRDEPMDAKKVKRRDRQASFSGPVRIVYTDYRKRTLDAENSWTKYVTDSLISCGVLPDDDLSIIPKRPEVVQVRSAEPKLVIEIYSINKGETVEE